MILKRYGDCVRRNFAEGWRTEMQVIQVVLVVLWVALAGVICYGKIARDFAQYQQDNTEDGENQ